MSNFHLPFNQSVVSLLSSIALVPPLTAVALSPALAQSAQVLPGIVVEGATLEAPPARRKAAAAAATADAPPVTEAAASPQAGDGEAASYAEADVTGIPAAEVGTAVTVVTGEDLRRQQVGHAAEALRSLPGVSVNRSGSPAGLTQVRIRGAEANHTLVLIDGVEANAGSDGAFDFSDLLAEDIERIEVIRGPQSALYGSNAVGGVVNIITRSGKGPLSVTARAEGGSFGTVASAARVAGGNDRVWAAATVQHERSDGFNIAPEGHLGEDDGYRITSLSVAAGAMLADNIRLDMTIRRSDKHLDRDDQTWLDSRHGLPIASDSFSRFNSTVLLMGADLRWDTLGGDLTHLFRATRNLTTRDDVLIADFFPFDNVFGPPLPVETTDEATKVSYQTTYHFTTPMLGARHAITGLVDHGRETFENESGAGLVKAARRQTGIAAEWRGDIFDRVFLSAGLRHDDNDTFDDFTTWRAGISVPLPERGIRPHASIGTGVKAPTMVEQFGFSPLFIGNPGLKPEESMGWDAGVEFTFLAGRAVFDVTYFNTVLSDKITTIYVQCPPSTLQCAKPINLPGESTRQGVEVDARLQLLANLTLGLGYTYLDAVESTGVREIRRPPHAARADVTYLFDDGRGNVRLSAIYNGEMDDDVFGMRVPLDDYWLVSAAASYKLRDDLELFGRVENLFDEDYEEVFGFNTAGVAAYAGLRWRFGLDQPGANLAMK